MKLEDLITGGGMPLVVEPHNEPEPERLPAYILDDPEVVGFPDKQMQENLYEYATRGVLPLNLEDNNSLIVVDIGAGRGDFKRFLDMRYPYQISYIGYEINSIHRQAAKQKYEIDLNATEYSKTNDVRNAWAFCIVSLHEDYGIYDSNTKYEYFEQLCKVALTNNLLGVVFILFSTDDGTNLISHPPQKILDIVLQFAPDVRYYLDATTFPGIYKLAIFNSTSL